eukprot:5382022-Ditylum_brightwellii.AAC.1
MTTTSSDSLSSTSSDESSISDSFESTSPSVNKKTHQQQNKKKEQKLVTYNAPTDIKGAFKPKKDAMKIREMLH